MDHRGELVPSKVMLLYTHTCVILDTVLRATGAARRIISTTIYLGYDLHISLHLVINASKLMLSEIVVFNSMNDKRGGSPTSRRRITSTQ